MKLKHNAGPWWYGWNNWLDPDEGCYKIGVGGGETKRPQKVLFWTQGETRQDHANAIIASFAATLFEQASAKDWEGISKTVEYIEETLDLAGNAYRSKPRERNEWLEIAKAAICKTQSKL